MFKLAKTFCAQPYCWPIVLIGVLAPRRLQTLYPKTKAKQSLFLPPLQERVVGNIRLTLFACIRLRRA